MSHRFIVLVGLIAFIVSLPPVAVGKDLTPAQVIEAVRTQAKAALEQNKSNERPHFVTRRLDGWPVKDHKFVSWQEPAFFISGDIKKFSDRKPFDIFGVGQSVTYKPGVRHANAVTARICTDSKWIDVVQLGKGFNSQLTLYVEDKRINRYPIEFPPDGSFYATRVYFKSGDARCYSFLLNNPAFGGILVPPDAKVWAPKRETAFRAMFMGDSFTESGQHWATHAARLLGWDDAWLSGVGATGYISAPGDKLNFGERLESDIVAYRPDVLVMAGGINDSQHPADDVHTAAKAFFDQVQKRLPDTVVFVLGPWNPRSAIHPSINKAIKDAAAGRSNFYWVPNFDDNWITGRGHAGKPTGEGNSDLVIGPDTTHPTRQGHRYLAHRFAQHIRESLGVK